jgi:hypothetical protein
MPQKFPDEDKAKTKDKNTKIEPNKQKTRIRNWRHEDPQNKINNTTQKQHDTTQHNTKKHKDKDQNKTKTKQNKTKQNKTEQKQTNKTKGYERSRKVQGTRNPNYHHNPDPNLLAYDRHGCAYEARVPTREG